MSRITVQYQGQTCFYYDRKENWMDDAWRRYMERMIHNDCKWRRWGIDPPVGSNHKMSWQITLLALMPMFYGLCELIVKAFQ